MNTEDVAVMLGVNEPRVRKLAQSGRLPGVKVGRDWVFRREDVEVFAATRRRSPGRPRKESE